LIVYIALAIELFVQPLAAAMAWSVSDAETVIAAEYFAEFAVGVEPSVV
jgi:hypothetical protein